jgi:hypothetical protein
MLRTGKRVLPSRFARTVVTWILMESLLSVASAFAQQAQTGATAWPQSGTERRPVASRPIMVLGTLKLPDTMPREFRADWAPTRSAGPLHFAPSRLNDSPFPPNKARKRVGKGALAIGILGTVGVVAGVVALSESNTNRNCMNGSGSREVCSDVHTVGEVLIPTSAVVACLGYFFAFRHAR